MPKTIPTAVLPEPCFWMRMNWTAPVCGVSIWGATSVRGRHYTQFMVYDLDGDGRAEVTAKTADGTVDGRGTYDRRPFGGLPGGGRKNRWKAGRGISLRDRSS